MEKSVLVSIIIPAYNAGATLAPSVKSALSQTHENLEVIIVDDGSKDDTRKIAEDFKKADPRVSVLGHKINRGLSAARNTALRIASGDYILFLDADDTLEPFGITQALDAALRYDADYVDSYEIVHLSGLKSAAKAFTEGPLPARTEAYGSLHQSPKIADQYFYIKGKLLRKDLVRGVFFDESLTLYEDLLYDLTLKQKLKNYVFLKTPFYHYHQRIDSAVNRRGLQHLAYRDAVRKALLLYEKEPARIRKRVSAMLYRNLFLTVLFKLRRKDTGTAGWMVKNYFRFLSFRYALKEPPKKEDGRKIRINMLSMADSVKGQGVGSAYEELLRLLKTHGQNDFEVVINKGIRGSDILHIHTVEPGNYLKMKLSRKPVLAYVHFLPDTLEGSIHLPRAGFSLFKKYITRFYKSADRLVVVNPAFIDDLVNFGIPREKIEYIPNFVSRKEFRKLPLERKKAIRKTLRKKYGIPEDAFLVLGCGQVQTRKGVPDFVKTAQLLPDVSFLWVGGFSFGRITDGYEELDRLMKDPPANVTFTGIMPRSKMNAFYNASDLLFVPSYNELFPMTVLEAAGSETPLLLRNLPLYRPILSGNYLSADDNDEFARIIDHIRYDRDLYESARERSVRIREKYSEERIYRKWKEFYEKVRLG